MSARAIFYLLLIGPVFALPVAPLMIVVCWPLALLVGLVAGTTDLVVRQAEQTRREVNR